MSKIEKYILNPETLMVELREEKKHRFLKVLGVVLSGAVLFCLYLWIYVYVLGQDLPKTALLKRWNADWLSRLEQMEGRLDRYEEVLDLLEVRDDRIYRSVYGVDGIPAAVREGGLPPLERYPGLEALDRGNLLRRTVTRLDRLQKMAFVQSKSLDDLESLAQTAGDKAAHIPAIPPMNTDPDTYRMTSPFGGRSDPITGAGKMHTGMDFACPPGNPVYATGDGTVTLVESDFYGYGNHIEIDHGFGYESRYSHLEAMYVFPGQKVRRGDCIATSGRSGRVTGPHLHYEVMYRGEYVNPAAFMDLDLSPEDYAAMVRKPFGR
ncbi:MAG: M23 family metallopeptidase [Bacteroidales bacterium]|nr:M23 family metallopeptidase [Bacteroidales bacterium]